ncbi:hypothetical protein SAMD00019534_115700, partial [Acytostelium subglobosum LB1]|uniref:hypothetical protein n=1 Tax=Acytostelium subglobosum LB1 TaxID=1410327 RepID=UPI000644FD7E
LKNGTLPQSIKTLSFGFYYKMQLYKDGLPHSLTQLNFGDHYKASIGPGTLPTSLLYLTFGQAYNQPLAVDVLPYSLTYLAFGAFYDQHIGINVLPERLRTLFFGNDFNKPLSHQGQLPDTLTNLTFGQQFKSALLPGQLPQSLTRLSLYNYYTKEIGPNTLPQSLTWLSLGKNFNHMLEPGVLPNTLTSLTFGENFNKQIVRGALPPSLTFLKFGVYFNQYLESPLTAKMLPSQLTKLTYTGNQPISPGTLPESITELMLGNKFNQPLLQGVLPASITRLGIGEGFFQHRSNVCLPPNLKYLSIINLCIHGSYLHSLASQDRGELEVRVLNSNSDLRSHPEIDVLDYPITTHLLGLQMEFSYYYVAKHILAALANVRYVGTYLLSFTNNQCRTVYHIRFIDDYRVMALIYEHSQVTIGGRPRIRTNYCIGNVVQLLSRAKDQHVLFPYEQSYNYFYDPSTT